MARRLLHHLNYSLCLVRKEDSYRQLVPSILNRFISQHKRLDEEKRVGGSGLSEEDRPQLPLKTMLNKPSTHDQELAKDGSDDDVLNVGRWKLELDWLSKALEPALQLYKWASATGRDDNNSPPPSTRSVSEILAHLQLNKVSIQDWSLSDLTVGLYLIYLTQASAKKVEDLNGVKISSDVIVQELIYHIELAKGAYKDSTKGLARHSMLRERNILKFVKNSSVMRPGYYIGVDIRNKLVILGIRGTHTVYDLITDAVSSGDQKVSFEGISTHFGTAEAARWYLDNEMGTIRKCLEQHKASLTYGQNFRLRLVGHSLGGATAALLAIMLRKKSAEELGFSPDIVSAIGFGTPPCVSKDLAESCASYVTTVVLQDDIVPRLSAASLARLRNEILETDWMSVLEKEDWRGIIDLVTNAKQVMSSVQDVARKLSDYAKFRRASKVSGDAARTYSNSLPTDAQPVKRSRPMPVELFVPGTLYFLKRNIKATSFDESRECYTLWRHPPGEHFQRILLSGSLISDHKCDSHYYALRDVLKSLPVSDSREHF